MIIRVRAKDLGISASEHHTPNTMGGSGANVNLKQLEEVVKIWKEEKQQQQQQQQQEGAIEGTIPTQNSGTDETMVVAPSPLRSSLRVGRRGRRNSSAQEYRKRSLSRNRGKSRPEGPKSCSILDAAGPNEALQLLCAPKSPTTSLLGPEKLPVDDEDDNDEEISVDDELLFGNASPATGTSTSSTKNESLAASPPNNRKSLANVTASRRTSPSSSSPRRRRCRSMPKGRASKLAAKDDEGSCNSNNSNNSNSSHSSGKLGLSLSLHGQVNKTAHSRTEEKGSSKSSSSNKDKDLASCVSEATKKASSRHSRTMSSDGTECMNSASLGGSLHSRKINSLDRNFGGSYHSRTTKPDDTLGGSNHSTSRTKLSIVTADDRSKRRQRTKGSTEDASEDLFRVKPVEVSHFESFQPLAPQQQLQKIIREKRESEVAKKVLETGIITKDQLDQLTAAGFVISETK